MKQKANSKKNIYTRQMIMVQNRRNPPASVKQGETAKSRRISLRHVHRSCFF